MSSDKRDSIILCVLTACVVALTLALPAIAAAHNIPTDVMVQVFVKPDGQRLRLLVRAPLRAMRDVEFPQRGQGFIDLARADDALLHASTLWIADAIELYEGDRRLPPPRVIEMRVSLESDKSFASFEEALAHVSGARLPDDTVLPLNQGMLDVLFEYPIQSDRSEFSIRPELARLGLRVVTALRFLPAADIIRPFEFSGDPGLVRLDPRWHQAALRFVRLGFMHILGGTDHLLFLFCLVIPFRRFRSLVLVVTAFTLAHSITLIAAAYNLAPDSLWFPPLVETLIAMSIVYMALENIVGSNVRRRGIITFVFGLVHGFGFSFILRETLQFAGSHLLTSLLSFNIGVEIGQVLVLVLLIPALEFFFKFAVAERIGTIILSALVAHTGWHWMIDRAQRLGQYQFQMPALTATLMATILRWLILIVILAALAWFLSVILRHRAERASADETAADTKE